MGTKYQGTQSEQLALNAYISMMRASTVVTGRIHEYLKDLNLTVIQFGVLEALYHLGPLSPMELAQKHLVTPGNITVVVNNLVKRKLLIRRRQQKDRRCVKVSLTQEGKKLIGDIFPEHVARIVNEYGALSESELNELISLCKKLGLRSESSRTNKTHQIDMEDKQNG